jgi:hypothetical protein
MLMNDHTVVLNDKYQALTTINFTFNHAPDAELDVVHAPIAKHGAIGPFPGPSGGGGSIQEPTLTDVTTAAVHLSLGIGNNQHHVIDWGAYTADYLLDMDGLLLSNITGVPAYDAANHKLTWAEDSSGATADVTVTGLLARRSGKMWHWELAAPHSTVFEIKLPKLPTDAFDWTPVEGEVQDFELDPVTNAKVPGGYDAVRERIFDLSDRGGFQDYVTGATGRVLRVISSTASPPE